MSVPQWAVKYKWEQLVDVVLGLLAFNFNPRSPARGATDPAFRARDSVNISIHAPREGGDSKNSQNFKLLLQ